MSLARAVTGRSKKIEIPSPAPARSKSTATRVDRSKISSPVALLSATNNLVYAAPDLPTPDSTVTSPSFVAAAASPAAASPAAASPASAIVSPASSDDSSVLSAGSMRSRTSSHRSNGTLTDASSIGSPASPPMSSRGDYFGPPASRSSDAAVPAVPDRARSHSKRAHERLAQKRSMQTVRETAPTSQPPLRESRSSADIFAAATAMPSTPATPATPLRHPFGRELAQLSEAAEEFGGVVRDVETDADAAAMLRRGLAKYCAADYLRDLAPRFNNPFQPALAPRPMAWI